MTNFSKPQGGTPKNDSAKPAIFVQQSGPVLSDVSDSMTADLDMADNPIGQRIKQLFR